MDKEYAHSGMIDWLSLKIDISCLSESVIELLRSKSSRLLKITAEGELDWENYCWDSIRSDTHQVCVRIGTDLYVQGSPARLGLPNNVFGSLDIQYCASKMIQFVADHLDLERLPVLYSWTCTRIDATRNFVMHSDSEARQVLTYLKQAPEGRQRHSTESHGLYIGKGSSLHQGKIYLKGQDAKRNQRMGRAEYTEIELAKTEKLLRVEYMMCRHKIRRLSEQGIHWYDLTPDFLLKAHAEYFKEYFSDIEVIDMNNILEKLIIYTPTEGQARAAYDCYFRIRTIGYEQAKVTYTKPTWYRNIKHLKSIGFSRSDLNTSNVVPLRKRSIDVGIAARNWSDIHVA